MNIQVRYEDFITAINGINLAIDSVLNVENNLKTSNENLKACWEGDCKDKYYSEYKKIADKFSDYKLCLQGMKSDLQVISQKFEEADRNLRNQIDLSGRL